MTRPSWYSINAKADAGHAEIMIYDEIGLWGVSAKDFVDEINSLEVRRIDLRLNTPGGSVFDGNAIYNALVRHPAEITVHIDGLAASMGSVIALAGNSVRMAENAMFMIHNPWTLALGDAKSLRDTANVLDKLRDGIAQTYHSKIGGEMADILAAMDAETWYTADEALAAGFVDEVTIRVETKASAATTAAMARFKNAPQVEQEAEEEPTIEAVETNHEIALAAYRRRQQLNEWEAE